MSKVTPDGGVVGLIVVLLSGGGGLWLRGLIKDAIERRAERPSSAMQQSHLLDANLLTVAKARDELAEDLAAERQAHAAGIAAERSENTRLRAAMADVEARAAAREATLRGEIEHLEQRLRAILDELTNVKARYGLNTRSGDPA